LRTDFTSLLTYEPSKCVPVTCSDLIVPPVGGVGLCPLVCILLSRGMPGPMKRVLSVGNQASVSADQVDFDPGDGASTQGKSRSKRSKKTTNVSQSQSASGSTCVSVADSQSAMLSQLQKSFCELNTVVPYQKALIDRLTTQLNFVMSYLDITAAFDLSLSDVSAGTSGAWFHCSVRHRDCRS